MADESLRLLARDAIRTGRIPSQEPERVWGGPGRDERCAICNAGVGQLGLDLEFALDEGPVGYPVHIDCFAAWKIEYRDSA